MTEKKMARGLVETRPVERATWCVSVGDSKRRHWRRVEELVARMGGSTCRQQSRTQAVGGTLWFDIGSTTSRSVEIHFQSAR